VPKTAMLKTAMLNTAAVVTAVVVVCLPQDTPTHQLAATAIARLTALSPLTNAHTAGRFTITSRWRQRRLLQPWQDTAAGGPIRLLDIDGMRAAARDAFWQRWHVWQQVVAGTPMARPYWQFADRHLAAPGKYPRERAQGDYLAQPRIAAMRTYNALPTKVMPLFTRELEALQAGPHTYAHLGWLSAVPADGVITLDDQYLCRQGDRLAEQLDFLQTANNAVTAMNTHDQLVAFTARQPVAR
jgi:hypothetical protein